MKFTKNAWEIFEQSIEKYHEFDRVDKPIDNPFEEGSLDFLLYRKNWIDTVQWHLEDIVRDPKIDPIKALEIKRWIDKSNQERTDTVEYIDAFFLDKYKSVSVLHDAEINTESPAWAIDRLSILALKVYHMKQETLRTDIEKGHIEKCQEKLTVLEEQKRDLQTAIENLLDDIHAGRKYMKVYKQMKMYNDESLNPILYKSKVS